MLRLIAGKFDEVILTQYRSNPRALPVEALSDIARASGIGRFAVCPDPVAAWELARKETGDDDLICVTGSFFLAAEVREQLVEPGDARIQG